MNTLSLEQIKREHATIYNDFKEIIDQFQSFLKSPLFINFIIQCNPEEKQEWDKVLASTVLISQKIDSQQSLIDDLISYNVYAHNFFNNILGKYLLTETKNVLEKMK